MEYLNNTDYFLNYNEYALDVITNIFIPYMIQFELSIENYYTRIIEIMLESNYTYQEIYFSLGVYLSSQKEEIEEDMNIIRRILYNSQRIEENINNRIINIMNIIIQPEDDVINQVINLLDVYINQEPEQNVVPKDVLDRMQEITFGEIQTDEKDCPICMEEFSKDSKLRKIACPHLFHTNCLDKWLSENSNTCPICRSGV